MQTSGSVTIEVGTLQRKIAESTSVEEILIYLERLIRIFIYVDPKQAHNHLHAMQELHERERGGGLPFYYHLHRANLASLEYDVERALDELEAAVKTVDQYGDITEKIEVYLDYVGVLINNKDLKKARDYFDRAERLLESYPDEILKGRALVREGFLYVHSFSYAKATPKFLEADGIFTAKEEALSIKDHYFYTLLHSGLGTLQLRPGNLSKAAASFRKAIERCEEKGLRARLAWHQLKLADTLAAGLEYEEAVAIYNSVLAHSGYGSQQALAATCHNLALCKYQASATVDHQEIKGLLDQAEALFQALPNPDKQKLTAIEILRAQLAFDDGDYDGASSALWQRLRELEPDQNLDNPIVVGATAEIYRILAECHAKMEDYKSAYTLRLMFDYYNEQQNGLEDSRLQEEFAARFAAATWEKERESLQLRASQLQLRALRAQMNPHFLFNALNSIQSFITTHEASTASRYLAKFAMLMRRSLEYSNREFISLEDEVQFLTEYLDVNCKLRFRDKLQYSIKVSPELEEDVIGVPTMIIQPYVENAIEHGLRSRQEGRITVEFAVDPEDDDSIIATILDDGIGREQVARMHAADTTRSQHQSRGTSITQSRLELLSGTKEERVAIDDLYHADGRAAGTLVRVRIPVVDVVPRRG